MSNIPHPGASHELFSPRRLAPTNQKGNGLVS